MITPARMERKIRSLENAIEAILDRLDRMEAGKKE